MADNESTRVFQEFMKQYLQFQLQSSITANDCRQTVASIKALFQAEIKQAISARKLLGEKRPDRQKCQKCDMNANVRGKWKNQLCKLHTRKRYYENKGVIKITGCQLSKDMSLLNPPLKH